VAVARNTAIEAARGQYVAFLDDDDVWLPWKIRHQLRALEATPEAGMVYSQQIATSDDAIRLWPEEEACPSGWVVRQLLLKHFPAPCTVLVRREALAASGPFDPTFDCWEDYDLFVRLAFQCQFKFVAGPVAVYQVASSGRFLSAVLTGQSARDLRRIVDTAIGRLEGGAQADRDFADEVRARSMLTVGWQFLALGQKEALRGYLVKALANSPEMARWPFVRSFVADELASSVIGSANPLDTIRGFVAELRHGASGRGSAGRLATRRLQAQLWWKVALNLTRGSSQPVRMARYAAARALLEHPAILGPGLLRVLFGRGRARI
jgi:hypothetical protein